MNKHFILFLAICGLIIAGCSSGNISTPFKFGKGKYKFTMTDSSGTELLRGTLNVISYENDKFSGTYEFTKISDKSFEGFSSMNGEFSGDLNQKDKRVFINTNPRIADSNVFWNMKIKNNKLSGGWNYSVFRGRSQGGLISITK